MEINKLEVGKVLEFERLTVMVGHLSAEVLVFENAYELDKFKTVCEHVSEILEDQELYDESEDTRCLVDEMEQEAYMIDETDYSGRVFKINRSSTLADDNIVVSVYYGVLNSGDSFLDRSHVGNIVKHLKSWVADGNGLPTTKRMMTKVTDFLERNLGDSYSVAIDVEIFE